MKQNRRIILFALLALLAVGFIFSNSLEARDASNQKSNAIVDEVKPVVDPQDTIPRGTFNHYVRKSAHFLEFAALGFCLMGLSDAIGRKRRIPRVPAALLAALLVASMDETLQFFAVERGPGIKDVLIDFFGAVCGLLLMLLCLTIEKDIREKQNERGK